MFSTGAALYLVKFIALLSLAMVAAMWFGQHVDNPFARPVRKRQSRRESRVGPIRAGSKVSGSWLGGLWLGSAEDQKVPPSNRQVPS